MDRKPNLRQIRNFRRLSTRLPASGDLTVHPDLMAFGLQMIITGISDANLVEQEINDPEEILPFLNKYPVTWLSVYGLGDTKKITTHI